MRYFRFKQGEWKEDSMSEACHALGVVIDIQRSMNRKDPLSLSHYSDTQSMNGVVRAALKHLYEVKH